MWHLRGTSEGGSQCFSAADTDGEIDAIGFDVLGVESVLVQKVHFAGDPSASFGTTQGLSQPGEAQWRDVLFDDFESGLLDRWTRIRP